MPTFPIVDFLPVRNEVEWQRYPKAGMPNATVRGGVVGFDRDGTPGPERLLPIQPDDAQDLEAGTCSGWCATRWTSTGSDAACPSGRAREHAGVGLGRASGPPLSRETLAWHHAMRGETSWSQAPGSR